MSAVLASERLQGLAISSATVTEFVRFQEGGRRYIRVSLKWGPTSPAQRMVPTQLATCTFSVDDDFSLTSFRYESPGQVNEGVQTFEWVDGVPTVLSRQMNYSDSKGARNSVQLRVTEQVAVQTPLEDFTAEKLLDGPVESDSSPHVDPSTPPRMIWDYYGFPGWAGVASVATGIALVCRRRLPSGGSDS